MSTSVLLDTEEITSETWSVSVSRGKSLETDVIDAGTASVDVRNFQANFNPSFLIDTSALLMESGDALLLENGDRILLESVVNSSGDYGDIVLGRQLQIKDGTVTLFTGFVEDIDFSYERLNPTASISGVDALATLGATQVNEDWTTSTVQLTGQRLTSMLDWGDVDFPAADRDIDNGTQPVQVNVPGGPVNALQHAQDITQAEAGRLFVDRLGDLTFQNRYAAFGQAVSVAFTDELPAATTDIPIAAVAIRFGTEQFYFSVSVERLNPDATETYVKEVDAGVAAQYPNLGARNFGISGSVLNSVDHARGLAKFLLSRLSQNLAVVSGLRIPLNRLSASDRQTVCGLDIGDTVTLQWSPQGVTGNVFQTLVVEGVTYEADSTGFASLSLQLSDASDPGYFVVGTDAVDGPKLVAP